MIAFQLQEGWVIEIRKVGDYEIVNRGEEGGRRYYRIIPGKYSPIIEEEPENALPLGEGNYAGPDGEAVEPAMKLKGVIVKSQAGPRGEILYRGNLTNLFSRDGGELSEGGHSLTVGGRRYRLYRLVAENKNRILGYIGFYLPSEAEISDSVEVLEIENLA